MKHLPSIPIREQSQVGSLAIEVLDHFMSLSYAHLSPSQSDHLFYEVGKRLGREAWRRYRIAYMVDRRPAVKDMVQCIAGFEELWGWPCTILQQNEDQVSVTAPPLPFASQAIAGFGHRPIVSLVTSGLLGGIAEEAFGCGKVCLLPDDGPGRTQRRFVVYVQPTLQSDAAPEVIHRSRSIDIRRLYCHGKGGELGQLSRRERQVLQCVGEGLTNKEIAAQLGISVRTVEGHVSRVCVKLDLRRRADLIRYSLRHNLATL